MANVLLFLAGYILGIASCAIFAALLLLHRPQSIAPTMRRKYRDRLPEVRSEPPPMPECKPARDELPIEPIYMYGVTGEEQ
jgi:hypothetical protein